MQRRIIRIDMDAFFAAVEEKKNPALIGKPVVIEGGRHRLSHSSIFWKHSNIDFTLAHARRIDLQNRIIITDGESISYDYLILATGSITYSFGFPGVAENAYCLKTLEEAVALKNHIICYFEAAAREEDEAKRKGLLTFVIVGGGATGVEYAGALAELIHGPQPFRYHDRGSMITIGRKSAGVALGKRTYTGFFAWLLWLVIHLFNLIGFRNRMMVLINWAWDYLLYERAVRFVFPSEMPSLSKSSSCVHENWLNNENPRK